MSNYNDIKKQLSLEQNSDKRKQIVIDYNNSLIVGSILEEEKNPYCTIPDQTNAIWQFYKKAQANGWTYEETDTKIDADRIKKRNVLEGHPEVLTLIKSFLSFFVGSDGIVNENIILHFLAFFKNSKVRAFYGFQVSMENIHSESYSKQLEVFSDSQKERELLFDGITNKPSIKKKADWCLKWIYSEGGLLDEQLVAWAAVEGIFFSSSFTFVEWVNTNYKFEGLEMSNRLIRRDEAIHADFSIFAYLNLNDNLKLDEKKVTEILVEACEIEKEFVEESLVEDLPQLKKKDMFTYVEYITDCLLVTFGCPKKYNSKQPFNWLETLSLRDNVNNFEKKNTEYAKAGFGHFNDFPLAFPHKVKMSLIEKNNINKQEMKQEQKTPIVDHHWNTDF